MLIKHARILAILLLVFLFGCNDVVGPWATINGASNVASGSPYGVSSSSSSLSNYVVTTVAGSGIEGYLDAQSAGAAFNSPNDVAVDTAGNVYVADQFNDRIRKIYSDGVVTTLAGSGSSSDTDGVGTAASFSDPEAVALDSAGNLYVADGFRIRKITSNGDVSTLAGSSSGYADGVTVQAKFYSPCGIAVDKEANVYVADALNHRIRKISPTGVVTTLAGSGVKGYLDGVGSVAAFNFPNDIAVDTAGNVYVADQYNYRIRKISSGGMVTTLAGSGSPNHADGIGVAAGFSLPQSVAVDQLGNLFIADGNRIRMITSNGSVTTLAGGYSGYADGRGDQARFRLPTGIAVDNVGNIYVADNGNARIRKLSRLP